MLIEIQCGNFSNFDAALGRYVECGEKMIVSSENAGQLVTCVKCQQPIEVPYRVGTKREVVDSGLAPSQGDGERDTATQRGAKPVPSRTDSDVRQQASKSGRQKQRTVEGTSGQSGSAKIPKARTATGKTSRKKRLAGKAAGTADPRLAPPVGRPKSDLMSMEFGDHNVESTLSEDKTERCKKCGNTSEAGRCTVCKHVEPNFEKIHQPLEEIEIEVAGFQRWFCKTMSEGVSLKVLEYVGHLLMVLLCAAIFFAAVVSLLGLGIGFVGGVLLVIFTCCMAFLYIGVVYKGHQFLRKPAARIAWFQRPFWNLLLSLSRLMKWQAYDSRFKGRKIITVHDRGFGDQGIAGLVGLKNCQVLDLQGTRITDRGLLELYRLEYLHCLVLRKTHVTREGVFRLQQSFPRLWIWY